MMIRPLPVFFAIALLSAGIVAGYLMAGLQRPYHAPAPEPAPLASTATSAGSAATAPSLKGDISSVHQWRLDDIRRAESMNVKELIAVAKELIDARRVSNPNHRNRLPIYLDSLAALDPGAALDQLTSSGERSLATQVFQLWLNRDFEAAAAYYIDNPANRAFGGFLLNAPAVLDSPRYNEIASTYGPEAARIVDQTRVSTMDSLNALAHVLQQAPSMGNNPKLFQMVARIRLEPEHLAQALTMISTAPESRQGMLYSHVVSMATQSDPQHAFTVLSQFLEKNPDTDNLFVNFIRHAPDEMTPQILDYARSRANYAMLMGVVGKVATSDTRRALQLLSEIPLDKVPRDQFMNASFQLSQGNPLLVYDWVKQVPSREILHHVFFSVERNHPGFLEKQLATETDADMRDAILPMVVRQRAEADPLEALAMIEQYANDNNQLVLAQQVTQRWARENPKEMFDYAISNKDDLLLRSINAAATAWYYEDPDAAMQYVDSIRDDDIRNRAFYALVSPILQRDEDLAVAVANSLPGSYGDRARYEVTIGLIRRHRGEMEKIIAGMKLDAETASRVREYVETNL